MTAAAAAAELGPRPRTIASPRAQILAGWAISRVVVLGYAAAVQEFGLGMRRWQPGFSRYPFELLNRWDSHWYREIASSGYLILPHHHSDTAFFPLYALVLRLGGSGPGALTTGLLVSNLALLVALLLFYELARTWVPEALACRAAIAAAVFPFGVVFSMLYPESIAFALVAGACVAALRGRWGIAAVAAFTAGLTRPEAFLYALPLAAEAWRQRSSLPGRRAGLAIAAVLAAPVGVATFLLALWQRTGSPTAWFAAERTWGRQVSFAGPIHAVAKLVHGSPWLYRDAVVWLVLIAVLVAARRAGVPRVWFATGLAVVCLPLWSGSFESMSRYGLLALPAFVGIASLVRTRQQALLALAGAALLTFAVVSSLAAVAP